MQNSFQTNIFIITSPKDATALASVLNPSQYQPLIIYCSRWAFFRNYMGYNINQGILLIPYTLILSMLLGRGISLVPSTLYQYALKIGQLSLDLYIHSIKGWDSGPFSPFSFRYPVLENTLVGFREWHGFIVNLSMHIELLMYSKTLPSFF